VDAKRAFAGVRSMRWRTIGGIPTFAWIVLAGLLLVVNRSCGRSELFERTWASYSYSSISYPIWSAIVFRSPGKVAIYFLNLEDGSSRILEPAQGEITYFVQGLPESRGKFLISNSLHSKHWISSYDYFSQKSEILLESSDKLTYPFMLSGTVCGMHPRKKLKGTLYDFSIRCAGIEKINGTIPGIITHTSMNTEMVIFTDDVLKKFYLLTKLKGRNINIKNFALPTEPFAPFNFFYEDRFYAVDRSNARNAFVLGYNGFSKYNGKINRTIELAKTDGSGEIVYFDSDRFVSVHPDLNEGLIDIRVRALSGQVIKDYSIEINSQ
jgi:hypothetical protein